MRRFVIAPQAARDLVGIWRYIRKEASDETAERVEAVIRGKFVFLAQFPHAGHRRPDLTSAEVRFLSVYSYLIVYRPEKKPLQIVAIVHASRNLESVLAKLI